MAATSREEIERQIQEIQSKRRKTVKDVPSAKIALLSTGGYDTDIYSGSDSDKFAGFSTSITPSEEEEGNDEDVGMAPARATFSDLSNLLDDRLEDPFAGTRQKRILERYDEYHLRHRRNFIISPARYDPFANDGKTPDSRKRTFADVMADRDLQIEEFEIRSKIAGMKRDGFEAKPASKRRRWDQQKSEEEEGPSKKKSAWDQGEATPSRLISSRATPSCSRWDETPARRKGSQTPSATPSTRVWGATPDHATPSTPGKRNRWDETPKWRQTPRADGGETPSHGGWAETPRTGREGGAKTIDASPTPDGGKRQSQWDETTSTSSMDATPNFPGVTPAGAVAMKMATPSTAQVGGSVTPEQMQAWRWERKLDERNRPLADDDLDVVFPQEGYEILKPPAGYQPIRIPACKLMATPTPMGMSGFYFQMEDEQVKIVDDMQPSGNNLPYMKVEDAQYFAKLLEDVDEESLSPEEQKERKIMKLLLKIKNGTPPVRKSALRQITDKAWEFGTDALFNQILPLLMSPTLEDQERHLLVKVINRILYKLDDLVRPYVHKILVVIEPLLIDEDYYARVEGREIISNMAKAAGLATMISTMRPDIDNVDEYVRNTTARAFAVVASALGIPSLLPFLKAVCRSKKSWQARHTGTKIVQQVTILMGCAVLPHLKSLVDIVENGLVDEQQKVRTITALALASLAEAAMPYGIEAFASFVLVSLLDGIRNHRGKGLAAFLKAIGYLVPLMDSGLANHYTREMMPILIREFKSPDAEMKKIVLKVVKQCCMTDGVEPQYIKEEILPHFFEHFWNRRMALDRRNFRQLVDTTVEIANKVGGAEIVSRIVEDLKDESEQYRKMVMDCIEKVLGNLGAANIDSRLQEQLIDGILYAFQEQTNEDTIVLNAIGVVVNSLGTRVKPYLSQICGTVLWRLNNKAAKVRQQAADMVSRICSVMHVCGEEKLLGHLGVVLYEYLGEEYPEVLGSILGGLKAIVNVMGMNKMTPLIKDLLPRLTPILKNRHEKVQENCIDLVGRIADLGAEFVPAKEWMRICFELLGLLKAHKKAIRRAAVNTFGYIAKAIGPQDVLAILLNNLKVQERQMRVCTTVAVAIVAETCSPFTVLPALMNEYRVPELNVQNGILKSLSFLFEYIGEMGKDYIYAVTPLLEDALLDRDLVHRQTACWAVKHMALGVYGFGCEDSLTHLMNHVWPNIFETSPHMVQSFSDAMEGLRVALGPGRLLQYTLQGLFHPATKMREVYWKIYNMLYIGSQDALVALYPHFSSDEKNCYKRSELEVFL